MSTETRVPGVSARVHRAECFGSLAHVLGDVEQLQHDRGSPRFVE